MSKGRSPRAPEDSTERPDARCASIGPYRASVALVEPSLAAASSIHWATAALSVSSEVKSGVLQTHCLAGLHSLPELLSELKYQPSPSGIS